MICTWKKIPRSEPRDLSGGYGHAFGLYFTQVCIDVLQPWSHRNLYYVKEYNNLPNLLDMYSIENSANTIYIMFYLNSFIDFCKYMHILDFMAAWCSKQVGTGQQKTGRVLKCFKNTC